MFNPFASQRERENFGGNFPVMRFCRLRPGTSFEAIVSNVNRRRNDSLCIFGTVLPRLEKAGRRNGLPIFGE